MPLTLPRPLSHSSLTLYAECPQKYKFKYIDKIPEKPRHFFSFGSSVHQALEFFYGVKAPPAPSLEELLAHYREHWISAGYKDEAHEDQCFQEGRRILTLFYRKHIRDYQIPFFVEYHFDLSVDGVPVKGRVDRVDRLLDGRLAILDYKTGKALSEDRASSDGQLTMYQMALEELLGAQVARLAFYHLPTLTEQAVDRRPPGQVESLRRRIVETAEAVSAGRFEPRPEERKCQWCDYKPLCPVFQEAPPPVPSEDGELSRLVDRYGELQERAAELQEEAGRLKEELLEHLARRGYVRSFGARYEVSRASSLKWEFLDKKRVLELIRKAGLYERILAPSAPKIEQLMSDPLVDPDLRAALEELGSKTETPELKVKPI